MNTAEENMDFDYIMRRSWQIIWKHKILWLFGFLASCGRGGGSGGNFNYSAGGDGSSGAPLPPALRRFFSQIERFFAHADTGQIVGIIAAIFTVVVLFWIIALLAQTAGRVGLVQGAMLAEDGVGQLAFAQRLENIKPFFWRVLGLNLLLGLAIFALIMLLVVPMVVLGAITAGVLFLCFLPLICLLLPLFWAAGILIEQANLALIIEDLNILNAVQRGWEVFRANLGNYLLMGLILGIGGAIVRFIIALPTLFIILPAVIGTISGTLTENDWFFGGGLAIAGLCLVIYLPVLLILNSGLQAYIETAWTLTYRQLNMPAEAIETA
ncbi:MAG: hypothetical protein D6803_00655 [Anaerolineae bacterium]|nr:MAG: hypothetical protein D6803_00655 [Anaerolineae bacterium]